LTLISVNSLIMVQRGNIVKYFCPKRINYNVTSIEDSYYFENLFDTLLSFEVCCIGQISKVTKGLELVYLFMNTVG
jgi:hypothetical protein